MAKIYTGGYSDFSGYHIKEYNDSGTLINSFTNGTSRSVWCIAADVDGNIYTGGVRISNITTRKYNSSGTVQWSKDHGDEVNGIAVDSSGNVYTGGNYSSASSYYTTRKYNSSGTLQWSRNHGDTVLCIAVDSSGNVYTGGYNVGSPEYTTRKYNSSGTLQWSANHGDWVYAIAVDGDGNVYTGGYAFYDETDEVYYTTRKYNSSGTLQWSAGDVYTNTVRGIAVDSSGNVYTTGLRSGSFTTVKYNSSGVEQFTKDHGANTYCIAVDSASKFYIGGARTSSITTRSYDSDGTASWTADHGSDVLGIGVTNVSVIQTLPPGLALALNLAAPWRSQPGLAIPLGLGLLTTQITPLLPGLPVALNLAAPQSQWLPLQFQSEFYGVSIGSSLWSATSLQATRRESSVWAQIVIRPFSMERVTTLSALIGTSVQVFRGWGGIADYFLTMPLTAVRYDLSAYAGSITLECRAEEINIHVQIRTARGVQKISRNSQKWMITCAVDTYLKPGDTFIIGNGYSFVVVSIEYQISPYQATMIVREN